MPINLSKISRNHFFFFPKEKRFQELKKLSEEKVLSVFENSWKISKEKGEVDGDIGKGRGLNLANISWF